MSEHSGPPVYVPVFVNYARGEESRASAITVGERDASAPGCVESFGLIPHPHPEMEHFLTSSPPANHFTNLALAGNVGRAQSTGLDSDG